MESPRRRESASCLLPRRTGGRRTRSRPACQALRMRTARRAAFLALSIPTQATGTPPGTCAVASRASSPFNGPAANGTPITGRSVSEAANPGSAADSPAPAMTTRKPFARAPFTRSAVWSGCRWAEDTWNSYETPALLSTSKAGSIRGLSLSEPTRISTSGTSGRLLDDAVILAPLARHEACVGDEPLHLGQRHTPRGARGGDDVLLHHERAEVIGAERERHLADLRSHRHPGSLDIGHVVQHDARDRLRAEIRDGVGLLEMGQLGVLRLQRPADERREAAGASLNLADTKQVLDPVGEGFPQSVHHGHRRLEAEAMRGLHHVEPAVGARLLLRDPVSYVLDQNLTAAAGDRIESGGHELADRLFERHAEAAREEVHLRRREPVDVDRVVPLDVAHQVQVPAEGDVGVVPPLDEDLHPADGLQLVDLAPDLLE